MNVYDFDETIYRGDSSVDFFLFCLSKDFRIAKRLPQTAYSFVKYWFGRTSKVRLKEVFFAFVFDLPDLKGRVREFWENHDKKIQDWFLAQRKPDDLVISASPEFLLGPLAEQMKISLIASRYDPVSGVFVGENCYGEEKLVRFRQVFPEAGIDRFYSDSLSDLPLARVATAAFLVNREKVKKWEIS